MPRIPNKITLLSFRVIFLRAKVIISLLSHIAFIDKNSENLLIIPKLVTKSMTAIWLNNKIITLARKKWLERMAIN